MAEKSGNFEDLPDDVLFDVLECIEETRHAGEVFTINRQLYSLLDEHTFLIREPNTVNDLYIFHKFTL